MQMEPWYKVATPRKEVREGRSFNPDEFAIALEQVVAGTAPEDYRDPAQFFARTCFTRALREHAGMVLRRLSGRTENTAPVLTLIFYRLYRPIAATWRLYDGGALGGRPLIAHGTGASEPLVLNEATWLEIRKRIEGCMSRRPSRDVESILRDGPAIDRAIVAARRRVIQRHRQLGVPLAIWRGGQVVEVPPESVELPADASGAKADER
jgi:hypothetical protein